MKSRSTTDADSTSNGITLQGPVIANSQPESTGGHRSKLNEAFGTDSIMAAVSSFLEDGLPVPSSFSVSSPPVVSSSTQPLRNSSTDASQPSMISTAESTLTSSLTPSSGMQDDLLTEELKAVPAGSNLILPVSDISSVAAAHDEVDQDVDSPKTTSSRNSSNRTGMLYGARRKRGSDGKVIQNMQQHDDEQKDTDDVLSLHIAGTSGGGGGDSGVYGSNQSAVDVDDAATDKNRRGRRFIRKKATAKPQTKKRQPRKSREVRVLQPGAIRSEDSPTSGSATTCDVIVDHDLQQLDTASLPRRTNRQRRPVKRESSPELTPSPSPSPHAPSPTATEKRRSRQTNTLERTYPASRVIADVEKEQIRAHIAANPKDPPMVVARLFGIGRKQAWHIISRVLPDRPALRRRVNQYDVDRVKDIIANSPHLSYNNMAKKLNMAKSTFQHIARERLRKQARKTFGRPAVKTEDDTPSNPDEKNEDESAETEKPQSSSGARKRRSRIAVVRRKPISVAAVDVEHQNPAPTLSEIEFTPIKTRSEKRKLADALDSSSGCTLPCYAVEMAALNTKNKRKPQTRARKRNTEPLDIEGGNKSTADAGGMNDSLVVQQSEVVPQQPVESVSAEPKAEPAHVGQPGVEETVSEKLVESAIIRSNAPVAVSNDNILPEQQQPPEEQSRQQPVDAGQPPSAAYQQQSSISSIQQQQQIISAGPARQQHQGWIMSPATQPTASISQQLPPYYHPYPSATAYTTTQPMMKQDYIPEYAVITADFPGASTSTVQLPPMPTLHPRYLTQFAGPQSSLSPNGLMYSAANHSYQQQMQTAHAYHHNHHQSQTSIHGVQFMARGNISSPQPAALTGFGGDGGGGLIVCDRPLVPIAAPPGVNGRHVYMVATDAANAIRTVAASAVAATSTGINALSPSVNNGSHGGSSTDGVSSSSSTSNTPSLMMPNNIAGMDNSGEVTSDAGAGAVVHSRQRNTTQQRNNSGLVNNQFEPVGNNSFVDFGGNIMLKTESYEAAAFAGNGGGAGLYQNGMNEIWPSGAYQAMHHHHHHQQQQQAYYAAPLPPINPPPPQRIPVLHVHTQSGGSLLPPLQQQQPRLQHQQLPSLSIQPRAINWSFLSALPVSSSQSPSSFSLPQAINGAHVSLPNSCVPVMLSPSVHATSSQTSPPSSTVSTTSQLFNIGRTSASSNNNPIRLSPQFYAVNNNKASNVDIQQHVEQQYEPASSVVGQVSAGAAGGAVISSLPASMLSSMRQQQQHVMPMVFMPNNTVQHAAGVVYEHTHRMF